VVAVVGAVGGFYAYTSSQQPNIQVTDFVVGSPSTNPQYSTVQDQGRVSGDGSFSYTSTGNGAVILVFDNSFSIISSKSVSISYSVAGGAGQTASLSVSPGDVQEESIPTTTGQSVTGTFSVLGGSGNDIDFSIQQYTCTQTVPVSFVLVNSGSANGYATVAITTENGAQVFQNRFYVTVGQQLPENGQATISDCASHTLTPVVSQVTK
jgi:hypothetical protein